MSEDQTTEGAPYLEPGNEAESMLPSQGDLIRFDPDFAFHTRNGLTSLWVARYRTHDSNTWAMALLLA